MKSYASAVFELSTRSTTIESTYYPTIADLISRCLKDRKLPFQVRTTTSERRQAGGRDQPDLALYDGGGNFIVVCCEVKTPIAELEELALSVERKDQIGRYLALTGAVVVSNVRSFGRVTAVPSATRAGSAPPDQRRLEHVIDLWPSTSALRSGAACSSKGADAIGELLEIAAIRYAPIAFNTMDNAITRYAVARNDLFRNLLYRNGVPSRIPPVGLFRNRFDSPVWMASRKRPAS